jgi:hypothetical protein
MAEVKVEGSFDRGFDRILEEVGFMRSSLDVTNERIRGITVALQMQLEAVKVEIKEHVQAQIDSYQSGVQAQLESFKVDIVIQRDAVPEAALLKENGDLMSEDFVQWCPALEEQRKLERLPVPKSIVDHEQRTRVSRPVRQVESTRVCAEAKVVVRDRGCYQWVEIGDVEHRSYRGSKKVKMKPLGSLSLRLPQIGDADRRFNEYYAFARAVLLMVCFAGYLGRSLRQLDVTSVLGVNSLSSSRKNVLRWPQFGDELLLGCLCLGSGLISLFQDSGMGSEFHDIRDSMMPRSYLMLREGDGRALLSEFIGTSGVPLGHFN